MNRFRYCLLILSVFVFFSCDDKETANLSHSTYYVSFDIQGDNPLILQVGSEFTDPGVIATLEGQDVTGDTNTDSNVDPDVMGMYKVVYSGINKDGFESKAIREVIVCNPSVETDISGDYHAADGTYRLYYPARETPYSGNNLSVKIEKVAPGFFSVSDFFAGYYAVRAGYGIRYAMTGYLALNEDNTIDLVSSSIQGWGDSLDKMENAKYDPENGTIYWEVEYASAMTFYVNLTK
ncbi:MAG: BT_2262 family domain-containing protein [Draconibacterium sp.]